MRKDQNSPDPERLDGALAGITYCKGAFLIGDFTVEDGLKVKVLGEIEGVSLGQPLTLYGAWTDHPRFGRQFKISSFLVQEPVSEDSLRLYLGSGLIKGIGPKLAAAIVAVFGTDTGRMLDEEPQRLNEVPGIGASRADLVKDGWRRHRKVMEIQLYFKEHRISTALSAKIYRRYRERSIAVLKKNPYLLIEEIKGVGFKTADHIAEKQGIARDSAFRIRAGIGYALDQALDDGHCCRLREELPDRVGELLEVDSGLVRREMETMIDAGDLHSDGDDIYLPRVFAAERGVAGSIVRLLSGSPRNSKGDFGGLLEKLQQEQAIRLNQEQERACLTALNKGLLVITGGPGTGKTTLISFLVRMFELAGLSIALAAPTGRAAKRMEEVCHRPARTLHRLLEFSPREGGFRRGRELPFSQDIVIVDETSMIDIFLCNRLLAACKPGGRLVLVGDQNQLPSVGPGNVLADIIRSGQVPVVPLNEIYRQAGSGYIVLNAHRINQGQMPRSGKKMDPRTPPDDTVDFYFVREDDSARAEKLVVDLAARRLPRFLKIDAKEDLQVLSPMYRGLCGVNNLNAELQMKLNPHGREQLQGGVLYRVGDKVMQIRNDYQKGVFNGDIGRIGNIETISQTLSVDYGDRLVSYDFGELDDLVLAYAISVHKSQGSEYPAVVLPLVNNHYIMLQRNLLYTAVTRARRMMVIIGSVKALSIAVHNATVRERRTGLVKNLKRLLDYPRQTLKR